MTEEKIMKFVSHFRILMLSKASKASNEM